MRSLLLETVASSMDMESRVGRRLLMGEPCLRRRVHTAVHHFLPQANVHRV